VALTVFKTVRDLTLSGWVGSIPMHSRHTSDMRLFIRSFISAVVAGAVLVAPRTARSQVADSVRRAPLPAAIVPAVDSFRPPMTPRRAFLYSFLLPGYSQSRLGRNKAGTAFMLVEAISVAMIRESGADAREARRLSGDSLIVSYVDAQGNPSITKVRSSFGDVEVRSRRAHVEDWVALLIANHLFSGADAFVAANLWDIPARLGLQMLPRGAAITASLRLR
jgi:hypothetical protein